MSYAGDTLHDLTVTDNITEAAYQLRRLIDTGGGEAELAAWAREWGERACDALGGFSRGEIHPEFGCEGCEGYGAAVSSAGKHVKAAVDALEAAQKAPADDVAEAISDALNSLAKAATDLEGEE